MHLLSILTWIYAGVLVVALAASLTAIWISLVRIGRVLREIHQALIVAADETQPLDEHLKRVRKNVAEAARTLASLSGEEKRQKILIHAHP